MVAFRFLALLTVGFVLLMFVYLHLASQGRLEREGTRILTGPKFQIEEGGGGSWTIDLGAPRIEQAWPGAQRQPRLYLRGVEPDVWAGVKVVARAEYLDAKGEVVLAALVGGESVVGVQGDAEGELGFGPLWLSYEYPLRLTFTVDGVGDGGAGGVEATPVLRGEPSWNYVTARGQFRALWTIFMVIGAIGFIALVATQKNLFGVPVSGRAPDDAARTLP